jgi:hypothetical protein
MSDSLDSPPDDKKAAYAIFLHPNGPEVIADLERQFMTESPCFLANKDGVLDPLRAMARDAQRSMLLYIKRQIAKHTNHETPKKHRKAKTL